MALMLIVTLLTVTLLLMTLLLMNMVAMIAGAKGANTCLKLYYKKLPVFEVGGCNNNKPMAS